MKETFPTWLNQDYTIPLTFVRNTTNKINTLKELWFLNKIMFSLKSPPTKKHIYFFNTINFNII